MGKNKKSKKKRIRVTIEDYERFVQSHPKKNRKPVGLPARALSNPRLEQCLSYFQEKESKEAVPISEIPRLLGRNKFRQIARIVYIPMGGSNKR